MKNVCVIFSVKLRPYAVLYLISRILVKQMYCCRLCVVISRVMYVMKLETFTVNGFHSGCPCINIRAPDAAPDRWMTTPISGLRRVQPSRDDQQLLPIHFR